MIQYFDHYPEDRRKYRKSSKNCKRRLPGDTKNRSNKNPQNRNSNDRLYLRTYGK